MRRTERDAGPAPSALRSAVDNSSLRRSRAVPRRERHGAGRRASCERHGLREHAGCTSLDALGEAHDVGLTGQHDDSRPPFDRRSDQGDTVRPPRSRSSNTRCGRYSSIEASTASWRIDPQRTTSIPAARRLTAERLRDELVIVDEQHAHADRPTGSTTRNTEPPPSRGRWRRSPPYSPTVLRAMYSPSPEPSARHGSPAARAAFEDPAASLLPDSGTPVGDIEEYTIVRPPRRDRGRTRPRAG